MMIKPVSYRQIIGASNAEELFSEYAAECSIPLIGKIDPQDEIYAKLESPGILQCFGAFSGDLLIGFSTVLCTVLPHYGKKVATIESLFVSSNHRKAGTGKRIMEAVEEHAKQSGCVAILYSAPAGGKLERILDRHPRYTRTNAVFCRSLD